MKNNEIVDFINKNKMTLVYFYGNRCGVCTVVKGLLEKELKNFPNINYLEVFTNEELEEYSSFNVFTLPVVLFYIDGKEYLREGRNISVRDLFYDISRLYSIYFE